MGTAASIARNLGGQRQGNYWRCACPLCGYPLSLWHGEDGTLLAKCFGGCQFDEIRSALVAHGLFDDDAADPGTSQNVIGSRVLSAEEVRRRVEAACRIYQQAARDQRIGIYLRSRAITLMSPALRFNERAPHRLGHCLPAMVASVDVNGEQTGVHMTYLRPDGSGKTDLGDPNLQRECRGLIRGAAIRLAPHDPKRELIIGEGVETTLSAMQVFGLPGWSAIYAGGLKSVELPSVIRRIVIAADNDVSGTGQRNALAARQRWMAEGRSVRIVMPPVAGTDFNDVLIARQG